MPRFGSIILFTCLAIGAVEALAAWWMHPAPAGLGQPVLCYRPGATRSADASPASGPVPSPSTDSEQDPTDNSSPSSFTLLPAIVAAALPSLHCSNGTAARIVRTDGATIQVAFFEWDLADSTSVLEAFKHLPEQCMGSIGMVLIEHRPPRAFQVDGETLAFDHTIFRDPGGVIVHSFKGTWVSGMSSLIGNGFRGGADHLRQIRWKAGLKRFRPAFARVAQGAVRGIHNPDFAWDAFQDAMLMDLRMEPR